MQARGLLGDQAPHNTLPQAAADYIAELRQVQPHGPYMLGGFSGGGLTAWEIARQLKEAGEVVSLLVLLDTPLPMRPTLTRADKAAIKWALLREEGLGYFVTWAKNRWAWEIEKRQPKTDTNSPVQFHNAVIEAAFRHAISVYEMQVHDGATVLFRPPLDRKYKVTGGQWVSSAKEYVFADNDLTRFSPALEVFEVPGNHDSMVLEPNVRVLAAKMKAVIARAEGVKPSGVPMATTAPT
jgi:thioesterase domain-containing protein